MSSMKRKIKRKREQELKKELSDKVSNILNVPDHCAMCEKEFDKTDREMVTTWRVIVKKQPGKTRLYCPPCWELGQQMAAEFAKMEGDNNVGEQSS